MKVAILRPEEVMSETEEKIKREGFDVVSVPFIEVVPRKVEFNPKDYDVLIVMSRTAARIVSQLNLRGVEVVAIGKKTAGELRKAGIEAKVPSKFDSKTLYEEFKDYLRGKRVALIRSDKGDPILKKLNADEIVLYEIRFRWGERQIEFLKDLDFDAIIFSSRMTVRSFFELAMREKIDVVDRLKNKVVIAIGPPTKDELERYGLKALIPNEWTFDGVIELLKSIKIKG